jgi:hypothetical protein
LIPIAIKQLLAPEGQHFKTTAKENNGANSAVRYNCSVQPLFCKTDLAKINNFQPLLLQIKKLAPMISLTLF